MFSRYEIDEHNRIEDAKKQGRTIAHTGTLYGVRQETLEAYLKAERAKVWEEAAQAVRAACEACSGTGYGSVRYDDHGGFIDGDECEYCGRPMLAISQQAAKEAS